MEIEGSWQQTNPCSEGFLCGGRRIRRSLFRLAIADTPRFNHGNDLGYSVELVVSS